MWACEGKIDHQVGAEVKDSSVVNTSEFGFTGQLPGLNVCDCVLWFRTFQVKCIGVQKIYLSRSSFLA